MQGEMGASGAEAAGQGLGKLATGQARGTPGGVQACNQWCGLVRAEVDLASAIR